MIALRWVIAWGVWLIWIGLSDALDAPWSAFYLLGLLTAWAIMTIAPSRTRRARVAQR